MDIPQDKSQENAGGRNAKSGSRARRDKLISIEKEIQALWDENKCYEADAQQSTGEEKNKYFANFPYPYMNGRLHLGHAFSFSKCEFAARFQRLCGKNVLLPFSFHCTGMPIPACANRLKREFENEQSAVEVEAEDVTTNGDATIFRSAKSKVAAKSDAKSQFSILKSMGIPDEEIEKFTDAAYWLKYFPPHAMRDLKSLGCAIDWRRSFITTDANPFYDAFVQWQFRLLKKRNKIKFGSRNAVFSRLENQPCADHDRLSGENVLPMDYTLIKLKVEDVPAKWKEVIGDKPLILLAATLRPETMYGQTNLFALPEGRYGFYLGFERQQSKFKNSLNGVMAGKLTREEAFEQCECVYVCSHGAAINMSYQGVLPLEESTKKHTLSEPHLIHEVDGSELIGLPLNAPNAIMKTIYVLPMSTILLEKGTGLVTSVPSDSPDDYATVMDIKKKIEYYGKLYGIKAEWLPEDVIDIIEVPGLSKRIAVHCYEHYKIASPKDSIKLKEAKDEAYRRGFYEGIMLVGENAGQKVQTVKASETKSLIDRGLALRYSEPEKKVVSRSWEECIVATCDQWFLTYGEEQWMNQVESHICNPNTFTAYAERTLNQLKHVARWLKEWACSRQYGLGTLIPWEREAGNTVYIESLSDSSIYMAFYTIYHFLCDGSLYGDKKGRFGIKVEEMTDEVFDYIFLQTDEPPTTSIPLENLKVMRNEFSYWYPYDLRTSGKDLIFNHLTMSLYNHTAIWDKQPELWPRSFFCNGHVLVDAAKMSKSAGNFLTLEYIVSTFSADAARIAFADAGDTLDDANFSIDTANSAIMRLFLLEKFVSDVFDSDTPKRTGEKLFCDILYENEVARLSEIAFSAYEKMQFREALKFTFYDFQARRDQYKLMCGSQNMHQDSVLMGIETQLLILSPIAPHLCEYTWKHTLKKPSFIVNEAWPHFKDKHEPILTRQLQLLFNVVEEFRRVKDKLQSSKSGKKAKQQPSAAAQKIEFNSAVITVAKSYLPWQQNTIAILAKLYKGGNGVVPPDFMDTVRRELAEQNVDGKTMKSALAFANFKVKEEYPHHGASAFDIELPFDEVALFENFKSFLCQALGVNELVVIEASTNLERPNSSQAAAPGSPTVSFS